jgi:hypothetical protein
MKTPSILLLSTAILSLAHGYELHEWGTFTTVSGSDGILLSGLQREEEALPPFVHAHFGLENGQYPSSEKWRELIARHGVPWTAPTSFYGKGLGQRPVSGVTVKMETPVIYFHSDTGFRANVKVGFNGGTISQWYPDRTRATRGSEKKSHALRKMADRFYQRLQRLHRMERRGIVARGNRSHASLQAP